MSIRTATSRVMVRAARRRLLRSCVPMHGRDRELDHNRRTRQSGPTWSNTTQGQRAAEHARELMRLEATWRSTRVRHSEEVKPGIARERHKVRSVGRPDVFLPNRAPGIGLGRILALDWRHPGAVVNFACATLVLLWHRTGTTLALRCYNTHTYSIGAGLVLHWQKYCTGTTPILHYDSTVLVLPRGPGHHRGGAGAASDAFKQLFDRFAPGWRQLVEQLQFRNYSNSQTTPSRETLACPSLPEALVTRTCAPKHRNMFGWSGGRPSSQNTL